jgi:soluble lytic murein transglycosylase
VRNFLKVYLIIQCLVISFFSSCASFAEDKKKVSYTDFQETHKNVLTALKKSDEDKKAALELLQKWEPDDLNLQSYKSFWKAIWSEDVNQAKALYETLKKEKKYIRLRIDLLKMMLADKTAANSDFLMKESRVILKQMRGTSEGEIFEANYLKWLGKNKFYAEICSHERSRWISEPEVDYVEMVAAVEACPLQFEDFLGRLRRLIFAAKEYQAQREIELYSQNKNEVIKLEEWQKVYVQAIFDSHVGDPGKAFKSLEKHEKIILESDFNDNYFYIAQRAGELKKAEEVIEQIIQASPEKKKNELRFQRAFLFYQTKQYAKAHDIFDRLYKSHPSKNKKRKTKEFDQIAWLRAWTLFLDQKYDASLKAFQDTLSFANDTARLNYWIAMNLIKLGDNGSAQIIFKKLSEPILIQRSFSFYNLLGWLRYQEYREQFKNSDVIKSLILMTKMPNSFYPTPDDQISRSQLIEQYNDLTNEAFTTDEGDIQVRNTENEVLSSGDLKGISIGTKAELQVQIYWAQSLIENAQPDIAKWHLFEVEKNIKDRKNADLLAQFYLDQQFYYRALSLQQKIGPSPKATTNLKSDLVFWSSLYPETYKVDVVQFADKRKIDSYLVWSIMRAETQFKADAISPVGAVGLMQFMPYTAEKIGKLLNETSKTEDLFVPKKSIEYGAAYLKKLSLELDYQKPLVAAAYNGGPHRVKQWLKNLGQLDYDIFIEHIPFAETRTYTKRVLTFRSMYEKIYTGTLAFDKMKYLIEKIPFAAPANFKLSEEWEFSIK